MREYLRLINRVLAYGEARGDRTGTGTVSLFGEKITHNLLDGFPMVTSKTTYYKFSIKEILWMLTGSSNNNDLNKEGVTIWDEWCLADGDLGPIYGKQWRHWPTEDGEIDQIAILVDGLKNNPNSRRHIISAWNWSYIPNEKLSPHDNVAQGKMSLAPCHMMAQFYVSSVTTDDKIRWSAYQKAIGLDGGIENAPDKKLSCQLYCRSQDLCLGTPFNMVGYAALTMMLADQCGYMPGMYHHIIGDAHVYNNHIDGAKLMMRRDPLPLSFLKINKNVESIFDYKIDDFEVVGYKSHPPISFDVSV